MMNKRHGLAAYWLLSVAVIFSLHVSQVQDTAAVPREDKAEKEANFKQQALGGLFHRWTFDQQTPEEILGDFSQVGMGEGAVPVWTIGSDAGAPTPPNILKASSSCQTGSCFRMFVANKLQYEYPDVSVRMRVSDEGKDGRGGIIISFKDSENFYAGIVNFPAKKLEIVRVLKGQVTVLGQIPVTPKRVDWHTLRIQRDTIISKDVIEAFFDDLLVLSVQDQSLGIGQVGLVVEGNSSLHFDSLHAVPLFSQRPLSAPAAY
ncbi:MAG TPA: hypothetical protein VJ746_08670 [Nitrospira sp.]|nr:hypothetical protein [Nitrospira sp.]